MELVLILILVLLLIGGVPAYRSGTLPLDSVLGVILTIVLLLIIVGLVSPLVHYRWW